MNRLCIMICVFFIFVTCVFSQNTIKIMAANITSGNSQAYEAPGIRIFNGLKPDICCIQEFNYKNGTINDLILSAFGDNYAYYREPYTNSGDIPNGIVYRKDFKLLDSGSWDDPVINNRGLAYVKLDVPGSGNPNLLVISVHLSTESSKQITASRALISKICSYYNVSRVHEVTDYIVIAGDLNAGSRSAQVVQIFKNEGGFVDTIAVDQNNVPDTNSTRSKEHDFVITNGSLHQQFTPITIGSRTFSNGLVFDSRVYSPLSEVSPIEKNDSGATNMQHMAVIKAYTLPMSYDIEND